VTNAIEKYGRLGIDGNLFSERLADEDRIVSDEGDEMVEDIWADSNLSSETYIAILLIPP